MSIKVFISYADEDYQMYNRLKKHLSVLERLGSITIWQRQEITAGDNRGNQIDIHLNEADIILLLVSASFTASEDCWNHDVQVALERYEAGTARIVPIILKPAALWKDTPLGQLQALPTGAKPVRQWADQDIAFDNIAQGIRKIVAELSMRAETNAQSSRLHIVSGKVFLPQAVQEMAFSPIKRQMSFQQRRWLVAGIIVVVVILLGTTRGIGLLLYKSSPPTTGHHQQLNLTETMGGTSVQKQSVGFITEYPIPTANAQADDITQGPDGNLWFVESHFAKVGVITPQGDITEFPLTTGSNPVVIVLGPDHNLWVLENGNSTIAKVTPQGDITNFPVTPAGNLIGLAVGKDGNLWFTDFKANKIRRLSTSGKITGEFSIPSPNSGAASITQGPDGNLWFDEQYSNQVGRITLDGRIVEFPYIMQPIPNTDNNHNLAAGRDGNVWFTDFWHDQIGRITPSGNITEYSVPTPNSVPTGITMGPDGNVWFTECTLDVNMNSCVSNSKVGSVTPQGKITEYALATSSYGPAGITSGSNDTIWFTEDPGNQIGKITIGL